MTKRQWKTALAIVGLCATTTVNGLSAEAPTVAIRSNALRSVVFIEADRCRDQDRSGTGFVLGTPDRIVTAHHVVGGCSDIFVRYDGASAPDRRKKATILRVLAKGDLALLSVLGAPQVPALRMSPPPIDRDASYSGLGYMDGQPTAGDVDVGFSAGSDILSKILPVAARQELQSAQSEIDTSRHVLRINKALQPGMSGGPIIDRNGAVIGIVAGGLRAGAAPASWGWPVSWISDLLRSTDNIDMPVQIGATFYSRTDIERRARALQSGRAITCGTRTFAFAGIEPFRTLVKGTDDVGRIQLILRASTQPEGAFDDLRFDIWTDIRSGATVVTPHGYSIGSVGSVCVIKSSNGPFEEVVWSADASGPSEVQNVSSTFEQTVMAPLIPQSTGFQPDPILSTGGPQFRDNGMVFNRKAYTHALLINGMPAIGHSFETLVAKSGSFLGVGTINGNIPPTLQYCLSNQNQATGCETAISYLTEWTRFILATQLSTYPAT